MLEVAFLESPDIVNESHRQYRQHRGLPSSNNHPESFPGFPNWQKAFRVSYALRPCPLPPNEARRKMYEGRRLHSEIDHKTRSGTRHRTFLRLHSDGKSKAFCPVSQVRHAFKRGYNRNAPDTERISLGIKEKSENASGQQMG